MINAHGLVDTLEFQLDIQDLRKFGLSEDEITGYIEFFCDAWVNINKPISVIRGKKLCITPEMKYCIDLPQK